MQHKLTKLQSYPTFLNPINKQLIFSDGENSQLFFSSIDPNLNHKFKIPKLNTSDAKSIFLQLNKKNPLKQTSSKKNWKFQETSLLIYLVGKFSFLENIPNVTYFLPHMWQQISQYLPGRSAQDCKYKVLSMTASTITNIPWSIEQRNLLTEIIQKEGTKWNIVSQRLFERSNKSVFRTSKQCREHYMCFLKPDLKKGTWTEQEDYKLVCYFLEYGRKWSKIMKFIEGRNQNSIKNRFFLLFQSKGKNNNQSDLLRKVKRKRQRMQKNLKEKARNLHLSSQCNTSKQTPMEKEWEQVEEIQLQKQIVQQQTKKGENYELVECLIKYQEKVQDPEKGFNEEFKSRNKLSINNFLSYQDFQYPNSKLEPKEASSIQAFESFEQYISF